MNYREPRQIADSDGKPTGKWRYTCMNDGLIWAEGYCKERSCEHATAEEAAACYREWLLDKKLMRREATSQQRRCEVCNEYTSRFVEIGHETFWLCEKHDGRDECAKRIRDFYSEMSSW